jgi:hypothetical protein
MDDRYENQVILGWRSPRATALGLTLALLVVLGCTSAALAASTF